MFPPSTRSLCLLLIAAVTALSARQAVATSTNATWTGASTTSNNWSDTANWSGTNGNPDGGGTSVIHFAGTARLTPNNNYTDPTQFQQIFFDSGASSFTLSGARIKLFDTSADG